MNTIQRVERVLMGIGLLTILAVLALVGVIVYLWWDARDGADEFGTDTASETVPADDESA